MNYTWPEEDTVRAYIIYSVHVQRRTAKGYRLRVSQSGSSRRVCTTDDLNCTLSLADQPVVNG